MIGSIEVSERPGLPTAEPENPHPFNLTDDDRKRIHIVSGQVYPELAQSTADILGVPLRQVDLDVFADGELYVRHGETVRRRHVYVFQSHISSPGFSVDQAFKQQTLLIRAAKEAGAAEAIAVTPCLPYQRQDRKSRNREATSSAATMQEYEVAGTDTLIVTDLHAAQEQAFFRGACIHLTAFFELNRIMKKIMGGNDPDDYRVVAPDTGRATNARSHANHLGTKMAMIWKSRDLDTRDSVESVEVLGDVKGKTCFISEDIIGTGGTLYKGATALLEAGAANIIVFATHGQFTEGADKKLGANSPIESIYITNTFPQAQNIGRIANLNVIDLSPLYAKTIAHNETGESIHEIYDENYAI
ncbi:MAG TPA: ribose-phosphate diphosphokinase [Candidatus Saccharimonadales bacterium]|nr:ribose-phosphate diphosphokinase [Candidatus Saccharimonadales bacterium]